MRNQLPAALPLDKALPKVPDSDSGNGKLEINVLVTSLPATVAAIRRATSLLRGLNGRICLFDIQTVPSQLPLDSPPVSTEFMKLRLASAASFCSLETTATGYLCRRPLELLSSLLHPGSVVVIGCRDRWWPTRESRMAKKLRREGYRVILHRT